MTTRALIAMLMLTGCAESHVYQYTPAADGGVTDDAAPTVCLEEEPRYGEPRPADSYCTQAELAYLAESARLGCCGVPFVCVHAWESVGFDATIVAQVYATAADCDELVALADNPRPALDCVTHGRFPLCEAR